MGRLITFFLASCLLSAKVSAEDNSDFDRYKQRHAELVPVVAVADMYYGCAVQRLNKSPEYSLNHMVTMLDRGMLADKLSSCLADDGVKSEIAVNFGLYGCFYNQMAHLSEKERDVNMSQVTNLLASLPADEKQKSFAQCVSDQAVEYIDIKL